MVMLVVVGCGVDGAPEPSHDDSGTRRGMMVPSPGFDGGTAPDVMQTDLAPSPDAGRPVDSLVSMDTVSGNAALGFARTAESEVRGDFPGLSMGTSDFTIELWVRFKSMDSGLAWLFGRGATGPTQPGYWLHSLRGDSLTLAMVDAAGAERVSKTASPSLQLEDGRWHHVAVVVRRAMGVEFYKDGVLVSAVAGPVLVGKSIDGVNSTAFGRWVDGEIDEVKVWRVARTRAEISSDMTARPTRGTPSLAGYFPLEEGGGVSTVEVVSGDVAATRDVSWVRR